MFRAVLAVVIGGQAAAMAATEVRTQHEHVKGGEGEITYRLVTTRAPRSFAGSDDRLSFNLAPPPLVCKSSTAVVRWMFVIGACLKSVPLLPLIPIDLILALGFVCGFLCLNSGS